MIVPNICNPDYRVVKQAESLASAGYDVRLYCIWKPRMGIPVVETFNGVTYIRREWNVLGLIKQKLFGIPVNTDTVTLGGRYSGPSKE